jgi:hypothetical protein
VTCVCDPTFLFFLQILAMAVLNQTDPTTDLSEFDRSQNEAKNYQRRPNQVSQAQYRPLGMARHLPLAADFDVAALLHLRFRAVSGN